MKGSPIAPNVGGKCQDLHARHWYQGGIDSVTYAEPIANDNGSSKPFPLLQSSFHLLTPPISPFSHNVATPTPARSASFSYLYVPIGNTTYVLTPKAAMTIPRNQHQPHHDVHQPHGGGMGNDTSSQKKGGVRGAVA